MPFSAGSKERSVTVECNSLGLIEWTGAVRSKDESKKK